MEWLSWLFGAQDSSTDWIWWVRRGAESLGYIVTLIFFYSILFPKKKPQRKTKEVKCVETREFQVL